MASTVAAIALALGASLSPAQAAPKRAAAAPVAWTADRLNDAALQRGVLRQGMRGPAVLRAQILLDRAWYSVGEMDGSFGANMTRIVQAYQKANGLPTNGRVDAATWAKLGEAAEPVVVPYTVTDKDAAGPFEPEIPADMQARGKLKALSYTSLDELLGEKFHVSPATLQRLNPGKPLRAGAELVVPNVTRKTVAAAPGKAASIEIDKSARVLYLLSAEGTPVAAFPISIGGVNDPLPIGTMSIKSEVRNPSFTFDPALMWDAKKDQPKVEVAPGPNNPVGTVWMGLSKPHWGIHGTPMPAKVGHKETHGCIHLTNWDAERVATLAKPGFKVDVRP